MEKQLDARSIAIKAKFNGNHIMELLPALSGKDLGAFIMQLKAQIPDFEEYVLAQEQEVIDRMIVDHYKSLESK